MSTGGQPTARSTPGPFSENEIKLLKKALYVDSKIAADDMAFLTDLRTELLKKAKRLNAKFEAFYLKSLQNSILGAGEVTADEMALIDKHLLGDVSIKNSAKKKFLDGLKKKAAALPPEFDALYEVFGK